MIWKTQQRSKAGSMAAISCGEGPLVVLIHGVGLQAEAWAAQMNAQAASHRVVAVDLPGHGESAGLVSARHLGAFTDAVAEALDTPAVVIGHSFGAMIALDLATRYPARVTAVAALNAIYRRDPAAKRAVRARADSLDQTAMADPGPTLARWFGSTPSPEHDACRAWLRDADPMGYRDAYRVFAHEDGPRDDDLRGLRCPALFLTGSDEPNSTPLMSQQMAALAPNGRAKIISGAAHMAPMTHPAQVNANLAEFLTAHPKGA